jgi:hypothetical protein
MRPFLFSSVAFAFVLIAWILGMSVGSMLPTEHMSSDSKDAVRLGMGLVATTVALVLGLLVASAKSFRRALKKPKLRALVKACGKLLSRRELIELRAGRSKPHRKTKELLDRF